MKLPVYFCSVVFLFTGWFAAVAQTDAVKDTLPENIVLEKQFSAGATLHTSGWGLKFRKGYSPVALRQMMWEVEFSTYKSPKEVRSVNINFPDSRSFFFGKLNYVWFLRGGVGIQKILNRKPYWGGVQLSWINYAGFSLAVTKPVYLYIIVDRNGAPGFFQEEQYDPLKHDLYDIYGRGQFTSGFSKLGFYPGAYIKSGLEFEFGTRSRQINALEAGAQFDFSPMPVPIMAFNPKQSGFVTLYVSVMVGKRYNR